MPAADHFPVCSSIQPCSKHEALTASYLGYESFCIFEFQNSSQRKSLFLFFFFITCMLIYFSLRIHTHTHTQVGVEVWSVPGVFHSLGHTHPFILRLAWNSLTRLGWLVQDTRPPLGAGIYFPLSQCGITSPFSHKPFSHGL